MDPEPAKLVRPLAKRVAPITAVAGVGVAVEDRRAQRLRYTAGDVLRDMRTSRRRALRHRRRALAIRDNRSGCSEEFYRTVRQCKGFHSELLLWSPKFCRSCHLRRDEAREIPDVVSDRSVFQRPHVSFAMLHPNYRPRVAAGSEQRV